MSTAPAPHPAESIPVPFDSIEKELDRSLMKRMAPGEGPIQRARMSNLVIFCDDAEEGRRIAEFTPRIVAEHPARVLLLIGVPGPAEGGPSASILVRERELGPMLRVCSEQITLVAEGSEMDRLPFAVRRLLIGDLPTNLWWATKTPPPLAGPFLFDIAESAQQILYDSIGWTNPAHGVAATASWLEKVDRNGGGSQRLIVSDLNWRRLKYWRRLVAQALDPLSAPGAIDSISRLELEHGPHAVVQAWELASWIAGVLGWSIESGRVAPNVELSWKARSRRGEAIDIHIVRRPEGPPDLRVLRIGCVLGGQPITLHFAPDAKGHLAVRLEKMSAAARTITLRDLATPELVAMQLSDRDHDPTFLAMMRIARRLAQDVLG